MTALRPRKKDEKPGRTVSMDTIIWKARGRNGEKYTTGIIDDKTNFIWHFEQLNAAGPGATSVREIRVFREQVAQGVWRVAVAAQACP
jgi:hypothetical protein